MTTENQEPEQDPPSKQQKKPVKDVTEQFAKVWELTVKAWAIRASILLNSKCAEISLE